MFRSILASKSNRVSRWPRSLVRYGRLTMAAGLIGLLAFDALLAGLVAPASSAEMAMPDAAHGEQAYLQYCAACHNDDGKIGPPMVPSVAYFINAGVPAQALGQLLYHPVRQRPAGSIMPAYTPDELSDADLNDMGYYLGSLIPAPAAPPALGSAERGAPLYEANCAICHGDATGAGATTLPLTFFANELREGGAPPFVMLGFVNLAARSGYVKDMPTYGADVLSDADLADIAAFIYDMPAPAMQP